MSVELNPTKQEKFAKYIKDRNTLEAELDRVLGQRITDFTASDEWGVGVIELWLEDGTTFRIMPSDGTVLDIELGAPSGMNGLHTVQLGHEEEL